MGSGSPRAQGTIPSEFGMPSRAPALSWSYEDMIFRLCQSLILLMEAGLSQAPETRQSEFGIPGWETQMFHVTSMWFGTLLYLWMALGLSPALTIRPFGSGM